jgi:nifR3 family TIM-barrel protein
VNAATEPPDDRSAAHWETGRVLKLGPHVVEPPVVLAPMAGITNAPFRTLCREQGAGLFVSEMITARALVERDEKTMRMIRFADDEKPRSLQLYGVDPVVIGEAVRIVVDEDLADHVDLNFGCPVAKVTRKGGGSALPYKRKLLEAILDQAVAAGAAGGLPVTMKMRKGIDDDHLTFLDAGRIAEQAGVTYIALHARTAAQGYSGQADWDAITQLVEHVDLPVLGNGDVWEASDALRMVEQTGCAGVVVGRGCLGRPWLFRDLARAFAGEEPVAQPDLAEVTTMMQRHAELLSDWLGEDKALRDFRKHVTWYLKGFSVGSDLRVRLGQVSTRAELADLLGELNLDQPFPEVIVGTPRGRTAAQHRVALPDGWLLDPDEYLVPHAADVMHSGG